MKNKKIFISAILIATILLNLFSISAYATGIKISLEPEQVVLIGDSKKFKEKRIRTDCIERQDIDLKVEEDISSAELDSATNIIIDQQTYDNMDNPEKRNINIILKEELENNKEISFYGDANILNLSDIYNVLDLGEPVDLKFSEDVFTDGLKSVSLCYEEGVLCFDYFFDIFVDKDLKLHAVEKGEDDFEKIVSQTRRNKCTKEITDNKLIEPQLKKLVSGSGNPTKFRFYEYLVNGWGGKFEVNYTVEAKRLSNGDKYTVWEVAQDMITTPSGGCSTNKVRLEINDYPDDDEWLEKYTPDSTVNSSSKGQSASFGFSKNGKSVSVGISTSSTYSDIQVQPYFSRKEGICRWDFVFAYRSNPAIYSKTCEGKTIMTNQEANLMFKHNFKVYYDVVGNGQWQATIPYNFGTTYLSYPDISVK